MREGEREEEGEVIDIILLQYTYTYCDEEI